MSKTIEEAAREFAEREAEIGEIDRDALYKGFYWGAQHVLSLPLSERLNDAEKMMIRNEFERTYPDDIDCGIENIMVRAALERIFGKEMFED